jgi:hypothetical protein
MYRIASHLGDAAKLAALVGVIALSACTDVSGSGSRMLSVSVTTTSPSSAGLSHTVGLSHDITIGTGGELVLKKVQLTLGRIEISRSDLAPCADDAEDSGDDDVGSVENESDDHDDCEELSVDPLLVNVPVDDAVHTVITVPLAVGTYKRLEAKLKPVDAATLAALGGPTDLVGNSVRVEGTYKGNPFVFTSPVRTELELKFDPPLVIDASTKNATVNIDVTKWFVRGDGTVIDPTTANAGSSNAELVADNIRDSFVAFEDDDRHGDDDHESEHSSSLDH